MLSCRGHFRDRVHGSPDYHGRGQPERYLPGPPPMQMRMQPVQTRRMIGWNTERVGHRFARRHLEEDVVGSPVRGHVQAMKVEIRRFSELIGQPNPDVIARGELQQRARHPTIESQETGTTSGQVDPALLGDQVDVTPTLAADRVDGSAQRVHT